MEPFPAVLSKPRICFTPANQAAILPRMGRTPEHTAVRFWRDPDLPGLEVRFSSYSEEIFRKHTHDAYSVGLIETGRTVFFMHDAHHNAQAGQIALIPPDTVHACNPDTDSDMTYRMFYIAPELMHGIAAEMAGCAATIPEFEAAVVSDPALFELFHALYQSICDGAGRLEKEERLVGALVALIVNHTRHAEVVPEHNMPEAVHTVQRYLKANLSENVSLTALSELAAVSRFHLLRIFQAQTGLPPHAYHNQLRVNSAKQRLKAAIPLSQVAAEAGFSDQSHFSRVFKQFTGATPAQYRDATAPENS
ncbi:helix-turn-helix domain-containing protein [Oleidesulfovibrio sp.]|uniref:AraC family transcriptional regulator n=1 Tax=Oleidesulfovibrio sp. TaxID=2909707 RepID=UPI003A894D6D